MSIIEAYKKSSTSTKVRVLIASLVLGCLAPGFFCGVIICVECGYNPFYYLLMGTFHSIVSVLGGGHCWAGVNENSVINLWPYLPISFIVIFIAIWALITRKANRKNVSDS